MYCGGNKWLVFYQVIKVTHHCLKDEFVSDSNLIPISKIKLAAPDLAYSVIKNKVFSI